MANKASVNTKWKVIGPIIVVILGFAFWYYQEHHDMSDGHHGQPEYDEQRNIKQARPNSK